MTPEQDREQQHAHAEAIRARTDDRRLTPEQRESAGLEQRIRQIAREEAAALISTSWSTFTIQGGGSVHVSGSGRNITIVGDQVLPRVLQGSAECDEDGNIIITIQG